MKLNTVRKSIQSGGMNIGVRFSMDMNGKSFGLLTSGLYSDIIGTIVRELSSNAHDSHVAAVQEGLMPEYIPFEVSVPTGFDPHFMVRDFGTGLRYYRYATTIVNEHDGESTIYIDGDVRNEIANINMLILNESETIDATAILYDNTADRTVIRIPGNFEGTDITVEFDDVLVLYSTYFRSTKEQSNDFTGAFGLGSKTPLAYTDNFIVTNRFNGTKRVYSIYTNEENEPRINLMVSGEEATSNGLEVKLAVDPSDYGAFKQAIVKQLRYFDPLPTILNDEITFPTLIHKGKHFMLFKDMSDLCSSDWNRFHACVGNNAYEISHVQNKLFSDELVLRFNIGEVMVTASREELKYDDNTITVIRDRENEALEEYTQYVMDRIDDNGMKDYEKAEFLNSHHSVLNLKSEAVRKKVANPNYHYTTASISFPLTGWGCFSKIHWDENENADGTITYSFNKYRTHIHECLRLSRYKGKVEKIENWSARIEPGETPIIFIRDNSYAFLKKISHYLEENSISSIYRDVFVLDFFSSNENANEAFNAIKEVVGHCVTFVKLSDIILPKLATTPSDGYTTPVARLFEYEHPRWIDDPKEWIDVYTPLTKIDSGAYVIETYRNKIQNVSYSDLSFLRQYMEAEMPIDKDTPILALTTARYEKALEYGFKPISELIAELKKNVSIPVEAVNHEKLHDAFQQIQTNGIYRLFKKCNADVLSELEKDSDIGRLMRMLRLFKKRYGSRRDMLNASRELSAYMEASEKPAPSNFVQPTIDKINELLYNLDNEFTLLQHMASWHLNSVEQMKALIHYANILHNTTGESND